MEESTQLDASSLQSLLGNSQASLIPESLVTTMIVSFAILNVLGILFLVFYVVGIVRKWKVQSAIFDIHKDLAEIKTKLKLDEASPAPSTAANSMIASTDGSKPTTDAT